MYDKEIDEKVFVVNKMWEPIEIKPNDQSLVGSFIRSTDWMRADARNAALRILYVGNKSMLCEFYRDYRIKETLEEETSYLIKRQPWLILCEK